MTTTEAISKIQPIPCGIITLAEPTLLKVRSIGKKTMMGSLVRVPICQALGCRSGSL